MFMWLDGPGRNFKDPLPGSTNYMSAYDRRGNLLRSDIDVRTKPSTNEDTESADAAALERAAKEKTLPKETPEDMRPFPLNQQFRSESVLSEAAREAVWEKYAQGGKTVRVISVEMGVDMRRVAAVIRLKQIEKNWEDQVCILPCAAHLHDETQPFRLVLQTTTW